MKKNRYWPEVMHASHAAGAPSPIAGAACPLLEARCAMPALPLWAGRLTAILALLAFVAVYSLGIARYGWWWGMGLGWLPALCLTWISARVIAAGLALVSRPAPPPQARLQAFMAGRAPSCCRDKANRRPQCRRQHR